MRAYLWLSVVALAGLLGLSGCSSCTKTSGAGATKEDMQLSPKETDVVFMANLKRVRNTAMWRKLLEVRDGDAQTKKDYDDFVKRCGLDPATQIDSVFLGFPQNGGETKEFLAILRGTFNEAKLAECAKEQAKKEGQELTAVDYNGHKIYSTPQKGTASATILDGHIAVVGGQSWLKQAIDLSAKKEPAPSAKDNQALAALIKRARVNDGLWGAAVIPQSVRDQLKADSKLASAASMKDVFGSVDFAAGLAADVNMDLGSPEDATAMAAEVNKQVNDAKHSPQMMMAGLTAFLDGVKVESKQATFHVGVNLTQPQMDDLINRVKGLLGSFRGALGAGSAAPPLPSQ